MGMERRRRSRIACTTLAELSRDGPPSSALCTDISRTGLRLAGDDLPRPDEAVTMALHAPRAVMLTGRVRWEVPNGRMIGVAFDPVRSNPHEIATAFLYLASERRLPAHNALVLVDDVARAARLCAPLRRHGLIPRVIITPLDALTWVQSSTLPRLAITAGSWRGQPASSIATWLHEEAPALRIVELETGAHDAAQLELELERLWATR